LVTALVQVLVVMAEVIVLAGQRTVPSQRMGRFSSLAAVDYNQTTIQ
jgi:hypothetical protein